jgi:nicotinamidase-related amidase
MKKEKYVIEELLDREAMSWLDAMAPLLREPWGAPEPARTALLVVDAQRYFFDESSRAFIPAAAVVLPSIVRLADACARAGAAVVLTRHARGEGPAARAMELFWGGDLAWDDPLSRIVEPLEGRGFQVVRKHTYDPFLGTGLERLLEERGARWLVVAGVMTDLCCESAVRSAFARGLMPIVPADATATVTQELHLSALRCMAHGLAEVTTTARLVEALGG